MIAISVRVYHWAIGPAARARIMTESKGDAPQCATSSAGVPRGYAGLGLVAGAHAGLPVAVVLSALTGAAGLYAGFDGSIKT
jgi:hypothetical protein